MFFFCPGCHPGHITLSCRVSDSSWLLHFLRLSLLLVILTVFRSAGHVSNRTSLSWGVSDVLLVIRLRCGTKAIEVKCPFHHILSWVSAVYKLNTVDVDFDYLAGVMFAKFVHCNYSPFPFCTLWKGVSKHCPHSRRWVVLRTTAQELVSSPHLLIYSATYLYQSGSRPFILSVVL